MEAAKITAALEFVSRPSHGYNMIAEEHSSSRTGSQRQQIVIARALVNVPETEAVIQQNMKRIIEGRTTVINRLNELLP